MKSICQFKIDSNERLPFSLHDRVIENIYPDNGGIRIILQPCDDGWSSHVVHSVYISDCCWEDVSIDYKQRFAPFHIPVFIGKAVENTVFKQLLNKGKTLEIVDEYIAHDLFMRIHLSPYRRRQWPYLEVSFPITQETCITYYSK